MKSEREYMYKSGKNNLFSLKKPIDFGIKKNEKISCNCGWFGVGIDLVAYWINYPEFAINYVGLYCPECCAIKRGCDIDLFKMKVLSND